MDRFPDPDDQSLGEWTDAQLLAAISQRDERALIEVHRRYWSSAYALAKRHQKAEQLETIDDAFFEIWKNAAAAARSILPAKLWIVGMLDRSLARQGHDL